MRKIVCLLLLIVTFQSFGQNQDRVDSIKVKKQIDSLSLFSKKKYKTSISFLKKEAKSFSKQNKINRAIEILDYALTLAEENNDKYEVVSIQNSLARFNSTLGNNLIAEKLLKDSEQILKSEFKDTLLLIKTYYNFSNVYDELGKYEQALNSLHEATLLAQKTHNVKLLKYIKYSKSIILLRIEENKKALKLLNELTELSLNNKDTAFYFLALKNKAIVYKNLKEYRKAINVGHSIVSYEINKKQFDKLARTYNSMGINYLNLKMNDSAMFYFKESLNLKKLHGRPVDICSSYINIGNTYLDNGQYELALNSFEKAKKTALKINAKNELKNIYKGKSEVYRKTKSFRKAYKNLNLFINLSDSLQGLEMKKSIAELETKYQTQQKENEILQLTNENNEKKAALAQSRLLNFSGAGLLLLLSGIGFFFWQRKKQELKIALLENSIQASELEKKRIGKELHDGIAGTLIKLVKDVEQKDMQLSDKLLSTYNEVRTLSHQLDNTPMHGEAFMDRMIDLIPQNEGDRQFSFKITPLSLELKEPIGTHLYRIIQELIANNLKHAQATHTKIYIYLEKNILILHYEDNGIGIKNLKKGNGFKNIEHRLELIKGKLHISTDLPEGLQIQIDIPYSHEKD